MSPESGKYYAVPVCSQDPEFEIEFDVKPDLRVIGAQRLTEADAPQETADELEALKSQVKEGIAGIKKGGLKGALSFAKKLAVESMKDDKQKAEEKKAAAYKDPMDPVNAFALDLKARVQYEPIHSLEDKHKDTELFQFRSDTGYGVLEKIDDGLFREIIFTYPSYEYAEKHYPEQNVGHSVPDWRREDDQLHRMRVYYLSSDKNKAEEKARSADLNREKDKHFSVNRASTRAGEKTRFSAPDLRIHPKSGELSLNFLYAWFLPRATQAGRQIQYNWDALRVRITQGDKLIKRIVCWSNSKEMDYIKSQRTSMELMGGGYIGELPEGKYVLQVSVYNDEIMSYPFEVIKTVSTDNRTEVETYYSLKTPVDDFAKFTYCNESFQLDVAYPLKGLISELGSSEKTEVSCIIMRDGKTWPDYEVSEFDGSNMSDEISIRNNPGWAEGRCRLQIPFGSSPVSRECKAVPDGVYTLHINVDGKETDQIDFEVKEGALTTDSVSFPADLPLADFDFPDEHYAHLFPLKK